MLRLTLIISIIAAFFCARAQDCTALEGSWKNELGSVLVIDNISEHGELFGKYTSSTAADGNTFPVLGWVNNYAPNNSDPVSVAFSVRWQDYSSITSWSGTCDEDEIGPKIKTLWHLIRPNQEFEWERIIANSSTFRPVPK